MKKEAIHFGAGNIGRGFIGLILNQSGYHVTFVDVNESIISEIKKRKSYTVELLSEDKEQFFVEDVTGLSSNQDQQQVLDNLIKADVITTAVGPNILKVIAQSIALAISKRAKENKQQPCHIIACENMIEGSSHLKEQTIQYLDNFEIAYMNQWIGFLDAAVDRIVPLQQNHDPLLVQVEPFYEWVIDTTNAKAPLDFIGVTYTTHMDAYIERKLFTVNTAHSTIAYVGYNHQAKKIDEALKIAEINELVKAVLAETSSYLVLQHKFDQHEMNSYVKKTLERLANPRLDDDVVRVARSPLRKLSNQDRFIKPLLACQKLNLKTAALELAIAYALLYDYPQDQESIDLQAQIKKDGYHATLCQISGLSTDDPTVARITALVQQLKTASPTT